MTFPIRNHTKLKPGNTRYDRLIEAATVKAERFLSMNPSRRESMFIMLQWRGNEYVARIKFTSNQGTSHVDSVFESFLM